MGIPAQGQGCANVYDVHPALARRWESWRGDFRESMSNPDTSRIDLQRTGEFPGQAPAPLICGILMYQVATRTH